VNSLQQPLSNLERRHVRSYVHAPRDGDRGNNCGFRDGQGRHIISTDERIRVRAARPAGRGVHVTQHAYVTYTPDEEYTQRYCSGFDAAR
jgi:hypothetical protein